MCRTEKVGHLGAHVSFRKQVLNYVTNFFKCVINVLSVLLEYFYILHAMLHNL